ncbi:uncharacterized protein [Clytia hemisphaerica]|uniref:Uncharacterized protein n=2 Tax=Clytia hemisphaerica TaxID=252671 RepID=A0A7M5X140_9CNID
MDSKGAESAVSVSIEDNQSSLTGRAKNLKHGPVTKVCNTCKERSAPGCKKCVHCGNVFEKRSKTIEQMMPKYKTNFTTQTKQTTANLYTLKRDHNQHCLLLTVKKHEDGSFKVDGIPTKGWAANFWSRKEEKGAPANLFYRGLQRAIKDEPPLNDDEMEFLIEENSTEEHADSQLEIETANRSTFSQEHSRLETSSSPSIQEHSKSEPSPSIQEHSKSEPSPFIQDEKDKLILKDINEIKPLDVVATYTDDPKSPFWMFLVEKRVLVLPQEMMEPSTKRQKTDSRSGYFLGYWLEKVLNEEKYVCARPRTYIKDLSVVRFGVDYENIFVLPKHNVNHQFYFISKTLRETLLREVSSVVE